MASKIHRVQGMAYVGVDCLYSAPSLLGFGAMRLPLLDPNDPTSIDIEQTKQMIDAAWEGGVNYFDTAHGYHKGASEKALREALVERYPRDEYYLADKLTVAMIKSPDEQSDFFMSQLEATGTDHFDFYLIHAIAEQRYEVLKEFKSFDFARELKQEGKIRHLGCSFHGTPDLLRRLLDEHPEMEFVQLQLNYLDWEPLRAGECWKICREHDRPVIIMEPIKGGTLADLPQPAAALSPKLASPEKQAAFALNFAASREGVMTVLSGMSTIAQTKANVETFRTPMIRTFSDEDRKLADEVAAEMTKIASVPCTGCCYCVDTCPAAVEIPKVFSIYNNGMRKGELKSSLITYAQIAPSHQAAACVKCGTCVDKCPQGIAIPTELAHIASEFEQARQA